MSDEPLLPPGERLLARARRRLPRARRRHALHLCRSRGRVGALRQSARFPRAEARRPRRRAGREVRTDRVPLPRLPARGNGLPAAQHRLPGKARSPTSLPTPRRASRSAAPEARDWFKGVPHRLELGARCSAPAAFATVASAPDDLACLIYTSGTTGRPKGAMVTHRNLTSNARRCITAWNFQPGDVLLHALPLFHVHGLFVALHTALLNASRMIFLSTLRRGARSCDHLPRATVFMGVPTYYVRLLAEAGLTKAACAHMRLFVSGSAPLALRYLRRVPQPHRPRHPRALRHDRNRDEHLESLRRRAPRRHGRHAAAGHRSARGRRRRCARWRRRNRPHPGARAERDAGLLEAAGEEQGRVHRRRLLPHRRHRRLRRSAATCRLSGAPRTW